MFILSYFQTATECANTAQMNVLACNVGVDSCLVRFTGDVVEKRGCNNGLTDLTNYKTHEGNYLCDDTRGGAHKDCYCKYIIIHVTFYSFLIIIFAELTNAIMMMLSLSLRHLEMSG